MKCPPLPSLPRLAVLVFAPDKASLLRAIRIPTGTCRSDLPGHAAIFCVLIAVPLFLHCMRRLRFFTLLSFSLATASCSIFHRDKPAPVVEAVRTEDSPAPPTAARDLADVMSTELKLTPDQTGRVRTVLNGTLKESNAAKEKLPAQSPQLMAELKRINISSQKELRTVIGPEKFKLLQTRPVQQKIATEMQKKQ